MYRHNLVLVQGLFSNADSSGFHTCDEARARRTQLFLQHAEALGVRSYEWVDGRGRAIANRMLQLARGTARPVDAVEIITLQEQVLRESLDNKAGRKLWQDVAGCEAYGLDASRSFVLMGGPRQLVDGPAEGMRLLWFGNGLSDLSQEEFVTHYTMRHGPLVAGHANVIGLRRYRQVPAEQAGLCDVLSESGLGRAAAPAVFAELVMGTPPMSLAMLRKRRTVNREIKADEKRHIDFSRSMLLLAVNQGTA